MNYLCLFLLFYKFSVCLVMCYVVVLWVALISLLFMFLCFVILVVTRFICFICCLYVYVYKNKVNYIAI